MPSINPRTPSERFCRNAPMNKKTNPTNKENIIVRYKQHHEQHKRQCPDLKRNIIIKEIIMATIQNIFILNIEFIPARP